MNLLQKLLINVLPRGLPLCPSNTVFTPLAATRHFGLISSPEIKCHILPSIQGTESGRKFLQPISSMLTQIAGMKVKGRLRRRCKDCYFVMRQQRLYVMCKTSPRHKQMAMKARDYKSWILTHATQSKVRPY